MPILKALIPQDWPAFFVKSRFLGAKVPIDVRIGIATSDNAKVLASAANGKWGGFFFIYENQSLSQYKSSSGRGLNWKKIVSDFVSIVIFHHFFL